MEKKIKKVYDGLNDLECPYKAKDCPQFEGGNCIDATTFKICPYI